jgi:hypothetical protein
MAIRVGSADTGKGGSAKVEFGLYNTVVYGGVIELSIIC